MKEAFRALTKDEILNPLVTNHNFKSTNVDAAGEATIVIGFNVYVFDIRDEKVLEATQPIKL